MYIFYVDAADFSSWFFVLLCWFVVLLFDFYQFPKKFNLTKKTNEELANFTMCKHYLSFSIAWYSIPYLYACPYVSVQIWILLFAPAKDGCSMLRERERERASTLLACVWKVCVWCIRFAYELYTHDIIIQYSRLHRNYIEANAIRTISLQNELTLGGICDSGKLP